MKTKRYLFQELMKEKEQYLGLLKQLKDFDDERSRHLAAQAYLEQERKRLEVSARKLRRYKNTLSTAQVHCFYLLRLKLEDEIDSCFKNILKTRTRLRVTRRSSFRKKKSMSSGKI